MQGETVGIQQCSIDKIRITKNCDGMLTLFHWGKVEKKIALDSMALVAKLRTDLGM